MEQVFTKKWKLITLQPSFETAPEFKFKMHYENCIRKIINISYSIVQISRYFMTTFPFHKFSITTRIFRKTTTLKNSLIHYKHKHTVN